jgi:hypothetical protein
MHTARLIEEQFEVEIDGAAADIDGLFPDGTIYDRFGIVVTEMMGGLGASLLIEAAIAHFFDMRPVRRDAQPAYPEIYLFHVGGPHGDYNAFDFWPPRKEVFVPAGDPVALLGEINARGVTALAVPVGEAGDPERLTAGPSTWAEQAAARDRLRQCFLYSPSGQVADADVRISSSDEFVERNPSTVLDPAPSIDDIVEHAEEPDYLPGNSIPLDNHRFADHARSRLPEVSAAQRERVSAERKAANEAEGGARVETYRRIDVEAALALIAGVGAAAARS